jgi:diguanylate cyclase (GGDEF)-like protein
LRFRLTLTTVAVAVLPLIAVVAILGSWTYDNVERQSLRLQQERAAQVEGEVRSWIRGVETQLVVLDEVLALGTLDLDEQRSALRNLLSNNRTYQELTLVDADGEEMIRVSRAGHVQDSALSSPASDEALASVIETEGSHFGSVTFDETLREPLMSVAVPVRNRRAGTIESVLVATVRFKQVWDLLGRLAQPEEGDAYVVTNSGLIVAHRNPTVVLSGSGIDLPPSDGRSVGLFGQGAVVATHPLHLGHDGLTVVAEQPTSTAFALANRAREVIVSVAIVSVMVATMLVVLAARHVVKPIELLAKTANKIADGDLSHRAEVRSRGEIGALAQSLNTMTSRLGHVITSLEARVRKRTAELEAATTVQRRLILELENQAAHDFLTGLPNRYTLENRLDVELARAGRLGSRVALILIDLDNFKDVNDTFGHAVGDELLVAVGKRLQERIRSVDQLCRIGGDEFAVIQPDIGSRRSTAHLAERLLGAFAESFKLGSNEVFTAASMGVSIGDRETTSLSDLMKQADLALYRSKNEGRNTYRFFEGDMDAAIKRRMSLAHDLRKAIDRDELFLEYQPQVSLDDRRIVGVEALLRWRHPQLGIVSPAELVPIAEGVGLIDDVGEWVLRTACMQAKSWQSRNLPALPVAVNVSAIQLRDPSFVGKVSRILTDSDLEPRYLELEITESMLIEAKAFVERAIQALHGFGVRIAIDDFGRGYASLDYLRRYPVTKLKIDQSFVGDMETNFKNATIVRAVIELAATLGMQVIAEGVEPTALLQRLIDEGCEEVQGFCFSRPVSPEEVEELLTIGSDRIQAHHGSAEVGTAAVAATSSTA